MKCGQEGGLSTDAGDSYGGHCLMINCFAAGRQIGPRFMGNSRGKLIRTERSTREPTLRTHLRFRRQHRHQQQQQQLIIWRVNQGNVLYKWPINAWTAIGHSSAKGKRAINQRGRHHSQCSVQSAAWLQGLLFYCFFSLLF